MQNNYVITHMNETEIQGVLEWAAREGWNPGVHDAACFFRTDPNGFFIGKLDGKPIATGSAVIYDDHYAFCGLYMVDPAFRNHGYGLALTRARLAYIGERNAGIDGVLPMVNRYERLGYKVAHYNARFQGKGPFHENSQHDYSVVPLSDVPFATLAQYDRQHFPAPRDAFLTCWIQQAGGKSIGVMKGGQLCGYGVIRHCQIGFKIGPLFADNPTIANTLFLSLANHARDQMVHLDCPLNNPHAMALVKRYHLKKVFETARMYLKEEPLVAMNQIYGITTYELG